MSSRQMAENGDIHCWYAEMQQDVGVIRRLITIGRNPIRSRTYGLRRTSPSSSVYGA